ncbi:hypothetical protein TWF173_001816 [Orbilia oligospora]|nr:hypothetical protein TWF173_001816 [Orbilia oligospora]
MFSNLNHLLFHSLETLPFELKEQIFEYIVSPGPKVNIIIRDTSALEEEDHFNILPKNPPHNFARRKCNPSHKGPLPSISRRRECFNKNYNLPVKQISGQSTFGLSVIYQLSPIPANLLCLSKSLQMVISSLWARLCRPIKETLNKHIILQGKSNVRPCGSYQIVWYNDFLEGDYTPEVEDLFQNRCRFIFDLDVSRSLHATWSTIWPVMRQRISNIVFSREMAPDPGAVIGAFPNLKAVGVMMGDNRQIPEWAFHLLTTRRKRNKEDWIQLELFETGHDLQIEEHGRRMPPIIDPITTGPEGAPIRYQIPRKFKGLLLLPKELREEIFSHALQPTVLFNFRDTELCDSDDEDNDDSDDDDSDAEPDILLSYEIGPIPPYLLLIHPIITDDVRAVDVLLRPRISKIIDDAIQIPDEDENRFWNKCFIPEPSSEFLEIARNGRFIFDLPARFATDALDLIAISSVARNITYIAFHGFNMLVLSKLFTYCPAVETLAFFSLPTIINRWISTQEFFIKYANYGARVGNPSVYSRLEYLFESGDSGEEQAAAMLPGHEVTMRPTCKRRRMDADELDGRGRAFIFLENESETRRAVESTVIAYEFTEPSLV